jgi:hypothetical protein
MLRLEGTQVAEIGVKIIINSKDQILTTHQNFKSLSGNQLRDLKVPVEVARIIKPLIMITSVEGLTITMEIKILIEVIEVIMVLKLIHLLKPKIGINQLYHLVLIKWEMKPHHRKKGR